jgi:hypothetical protein
MTSHETIRWLAREYPTATVAEIGSALNGSPGIIRALLDRTSADDTAEFNRRRVPGIDPMFVRILRKRLVARLAVAS